MWDALDITPEAADALGLASVCVTDFLCGALETQTQPDGWVRPMRLAMSQRRALTSCSAWHPGLFRQMATTTAGVCIAFATDANEVALAVRLDEAPTATKATLRGLESQDEGQPLVQDGVSVVVDGRPLGIFVPARDIVRFSLVDPAKDPGGGMLALPGLGVEHEVRLWLPCLRGCVVRELWADGTYVRALPARGRLLVFGDELGQGYCCGDPARSWAALAAERLGLELINQSVGGQVFQPSSVVGAPIDGVERIVVELGSNYRQERCSAATVGSDIREFLSEISRTWPDATTCVVTPSWIPSRGPMRRGSCYDQVESFEIRCARAHNLRVIDGKRLVPDGLSELPSGAEVLDSRKSELFAERLVVMWEMGAQTSAQRKRLALDVLSRAPLYAFPAAEALRRGRGEALFAREGCVMVKTKNDDYLLYAPDARLAQVACALFDRDGDGFCNVLGTKHLHALADTLGLDHSEPYHLCVYEKAEPLPIVEHLAACLYPLDATYADVVRAHYEQSDFVRDDLLLASLAQGRFIGAFCDDELVGFVGEHEEGSIGLLEVFEGHRREGWGEALVAAKVNACLNKGEVPWTEVYPQNRASLRLHKKLGFSVVGSSKTCYLSRGTKGGR